MSGNETEVTAQDQDESLATTRYTSTDDKTQHTQETVNGHQHDVHYQSDEEQTLNGTFDDRLAEFVDGRVKMIQDEREKRENERANRRNLNRFVALVFALVIGLLLTYGFGNHWFGPEGAKLQPYSFVITIFLDASVVAYALIKHY